MQKKLSIQYTVSLLLKEKLKGKIVYLSGPMGSGKTTLVRLYSRLATGNPDLIVPSPSYSILNLYPSVPLAHVDLQSVHSIDSLYMLDLIGWQDKGYIMFIEWAHDWVRSYLHSYCEIELDSWHRVLQCNMPLPQQKRGK